MKHKEIKGFEEAIKALHDETPTVLLPCFRETPRDAYVNEVTNRCRRIMEAQPPEYTRIYLIFQEGISESECNTVWDLCQALTNVRLEDLLKTDKGDLVAIYSFGNIETDILKKVMDLASEAEIIDEYTGKVTHRVKNPRTRKRRKR